MFRVLMVLALCCTATTSRADTQVSPAMFDFRKQFEDCINTPHDNPYNACLGVIGAAYTLRREITGALQTCIHANVEGCVEAFNTAGFPADTLNIANLNRCEMINLEETDFRDISLEGTCIEQIARTIERKGIPTTHNADISCGIHYIECSEIVFNGSQYLEEAVLEIYQDKLDAIPLSNEFEKGVSHRYYSLLMRQRDLQIDLARTNCKIETVIPHWANPMDFASCMGQAYSDMWVTLKNEDN